MTLLGKLRFVEIVAVREVSARVLPVLIQEELVDVIIDIIVVRHIALGASRRIELRQAP
jgi:hypothetical protein